MIIAIPVDQNKEDTNVCISFGRAPYYLMYQTEQQKVSFTGNPAAESASGAGIMAAQFLVDQHVDILLTPRCGENAANVLVAAGIKIYQTTSSSAKDSIVAYESGVLRPLQEVHPGFHGHRGL